MIVLAARQGDRVVGTVQLRLNCAAMPDGTLAPTTYFYREL